MSKITMKKLPFSSDGLLGFLALLLHLLYRDFKRYVRGEVLSK